MNWRYYKVPRGFKSDGCTLFTDGKEYKECCIMHDHARQNDTISNKEADSMFFDCMKAKTNIFLASIVYVAVRLQGLSNLNPVGFAMLALFISLVGYLIYRG